MTVLITDPDLASRLKAQREESGSDRFDEVWEGIYTTPPLPNNDHQTIQGQFVAVLRDALGWDSSATICAGVNVSDRAENWQFNYRSPDVLVYLPGNPAINHGTHWQGGPDFLVEILSPYDRGRDKLAFYAAVGVREALVIDRDPWALELYRRHETTGELRIAGTASLTNGAHLESQVLPIRLRLIPNALRPRIEVNRIDTATAATAGSRRQWAI